MIPAFPLAFRPLYGLAVGVAAALVLERWHALPAVLCWTILAWLPEQFISDRRGWLLQALAVLVEWQLLEVLGSNVVCLIVPVVSQAAVVTLAWISRPAAAPAPSAASLTSMGAVFAIALGIFAAFLFGWLTGQLFYGPIIVIASYLVVKLVRTRAYQTIGGVDHDSLVYTRLAIEVAVLLILFSVPPPEEYQRFGAR